jgi:hypothetical protein
LGGNGIPEATGVFEGAGVIVGRNTIWVGLSIAVRGGCTEFEGVAAEKEQPHNTKINRKNSHLAENFIQ